MCIGTQAMNIINNYKKKGGREEREREGIIIINGERKEVR